MDYNLSSFAVTVKQSAGRRFATEPHPYRTDFDRDRDRVIHSQAFRRLEGKTQVFTPGINDSYRNRLTHSIEVAQIGRTIARAVGLNESLTEAICLAHDIGHSPFGHTGESVLNKLTEGIGGFEHNKQALRIVDLLEHPYPGFQGLNLMYETRLGLAKHSSPYDKPGAGEFKQLQSSLEGQIADVADRIAYNCHDLEDGLRSKLITEDQLKGIDLFCQGREMIGAEDIQDYTLRRIRTAKSIIDILVSDAIEASRVAIEKSKVKTLQDVYQSPKRLIVVTDQADKDLQVLEKFLLENMYLSPTLRETAKQIDLWLSELFARILKKPEIMPPYFQNFIPDEGLERTVCDYIAGMTDRFCLSTLEGAI
ncbi:MAG: dNTP triphosphohydrolase [Planctomycetes bacterium]|nr:dNTP triphosphohydrolase [Planctomycetota bacterium]